jgi:hypothetical protein
MSKIEALAKHWECGVKDIFEEGDNRFSVGSKEFLVLTDEESDESASDCIRDLLWAFKPEFLAAHSSVADAKTFAALQESMHEDANDAIKRLIDDVEDLVRDAILSDGRGHFLSHYDGNEHEVSEFFVYRVG